MKPLTFRLPDSAIPSAWYNIAADLPEPVPPMLSPATREPITPGDLEALFPEPLIEQEFTDERYVDIPGPVMDILRLWRPSPLHRARRLERALGTPARIYYKYEGVSPSGSHKANTAVPQAFYNRASGTKRVATETGAGQWGSAMAQACSYFGLECDVYWVRLSHDQKTARRALMELFGANVIPSPSSRTAAGQAALAEDPDSPGSLGIAISEAVEAAATSGGTTKYALGSVLNHVLIHQSVIGEEALLQMTLADDTPDVIVGCTGGGSNFGGLAFPFLREAWAGGRTLRAVAAEPESCPSLTEGRLDYDFGDTAATTPLMRMHTLGHEFMPPRHHAGGLRYHGMAPLVSHLVDSGIVEARALSQQACFEAAATFARAEGIIPAPESAHAVGVALDEATRARDLNMESVILLGVSGHGHFDMAAYEAFLGGRLCA